MEYAYYKLKCNKCGRKILVEMALIGIPHHTGVSATCADCVDMTTPQAQLLAKQHPDVAKELAEWFREE